jgi:uncharacterized LabA/DUF88 family protein
MQLVPRPQNNENFNEFSSENSSISYSELPIATSFPFPSRHGSKEVAAQERVAIFIDGSNLFYAASQLNIEIDYAKFLHFLVNGRKLLRAYFYTGVDRTNEKQQGFLLWMSRNGYRVITKDLQPLPDGSKKANLDVEMAVDMVALVGSYDTAILVTGDGDLAYAANAIAYHGVWVEVVSLPSMTSDSLLNLADFHTDLSTIQPDICRDYSKSPMMDGDR